MRFLTHRVWLGVALIVILSISLSVGLSGCTAIDEEYCATNADCIRITSGSAGSTFCHPTRHVCLSSGHCLSDADCLSSDASRCDGDTNQCVSCLLGDTSCAHIEAKPLCGQTSGGGTSCVACLQNLDCPVSAPICDGQRCRSCQQHSECAGMLNCDDGTAAGAACNESLVCIMAGDLDSALTGRCAKNGDAQNARVVYVHNDSTICSDSANGDTVTMPFCSLQSAYEAAKLQQRTFVRVLAAPDDYQMLNDPADNPVQSGQVIFIGAPAPSQGVSKPATLDFYDAPLSVVNAGNVTLDGFVLFQTPLGKGATVLSCVGAKNSVPRLVVRNNQITGSMGSGDTMIAPAIDLTDCQAKIQGNVIGVGSMSAAQVEHNAFTRGLRIISQQISDTSFLIENNVIAGNWDLGVDLDPVAITGVTFQFNTVVGNGGGIRCPSSNKVVTIADSIVFGNGSGAQFVAGAKCVFQQVVVGLTGDIGSGLINKTPALGDAFELTSDSANLDCCVDQASPGNGASFPPVDIKGLGRPQGKAWDLGAYELSASM